MRSEARVVYEGLAVGGPLDGETVQSRYPKGFLLVDKPNNRAWVYDYDEGHNKSGDRLADRSRFVAREQYTLDHAKRLRAAEEFDYDVRAFDYDLRAVDHGDDNDS